MSTTRVIHFFTILIYLFLSPVTVAATPPPQFIAFSPNPVMGALYYPDPEVFPEPHIAMLNIHRDSSRMSHSSMEEMPKRGIVILGINSVCHNNEALCTSWENNALAISQGVEYLKNLPGIDTVVLLGGSGGGPTMGFYQAVAKQGVKFCQQVQKLTRCSDELANLPPADGIVLRDAHPGNGLGVMRSLNPAIVNDEEIMNHYASPEIDPSLDPFNPENGYKPDGSVYTNAFKERYFIAQATRMNRLIDIARDKMQKINSGTYRHPDDDAFIVPAGAGARLANLDASIDHTTTRPQQLLRNDGSVEDCCIVESVRNVGQTPDQSRSLSGSLFLTLRSFLSVAAIRGTHAMEQIDWCSSNNSTPCGLQQVSVPLLVVAMSGHYFIRDGEFIYDMAASKDKEFIIIEGATHGGTPCRSCMPSGLAYDGRYDNSEKNYYDYVAKWLNNRF